MSKVKTAIGIDFDVKGVRMVKVKSVTIGKEVKPSIMAMHEASGDYAQKEALIAALKNCAEKIKAKSDDRVVTSASGRQVYLTQMRVKTQPETDIKKMLRAEIRKNITFELSGAVLDYQVMDSGEANGETRLITATAVAKTLIEQQTKILESAGLMPAVLDVLPAVVANTCWIAPAAEALQQKAHVLAHLAPDLCTLVIDGHNVPFYTRSIYCSLDRFFGAQSGDSNAQEKTIQLGTLAEEIRRSLAYYNTANGISEFVGLSPIGNYGDNAEVQWFFHKNTGLDVKVSSLLPRMGYARQETPGKYDVAIALAVRGLDN
jgi:Tfp pilus assembly PilM family ATPase